MSEWRFIEEFSADQELHRILPVGTFKRFGRKVEITPEKVRDMVDNFNRSIPDTGVPINAEHARTEGRVGQVTGLVDRPDGAYASLEFTEAGQQLMAQERFGYVSPEIVWGPTDWEQYEQVTNILVGLALTNTPFFGQGVRLFTLEDKQDKDGGTDDPPITNSVEEPMEDEQKIPKWFTQLIAGKADPTPAPVQHTGPTPEEFEALQKEKQELEAKLSKQKAEQEHAARVAEYSALVPDAAPATLPEALALFDAVDPVAAKLLVEEYRALYAQVEEAGLFTEIGSASPTNDEHASAAEQFNAMVQQVSKEKGISVGEAMEQVARERPDLLEAARDAGRIN